MAVHTASQVPMEATMRVIVATFTGLVALAAISVQAAPLAPTKITGAELGASPSIELVRQGCGWGWHRGRWRDRWHWGGCYRNW
jgi:hypothetical protein